MVQSLLYFSFIILLTSTWCWFRSNKEICYWHHFSSKSPNFLILLLIPDQIILNHGVVVRAVTQWATSSPLQHSPQPQQHKAAAPAERSPKEGGLVGAGLKGQAQRIRVHHQLRSIGLPAVRCHTMQMQLLCQPHYQHNQVGPTYCNPKYCAINTIGA